MKLLKNIQSHLSKKDTQEERVKLSTTYIPLIARVCFYFILISLYLLDFKLLVLHKVDLFFIVWITTEGEELKGR